MNLEARIVDTPLHIENLRVVSLNTSRYHQDLHDIVKHAKEKHSNNREWYCNTYSTINNVDLFKHESAKTIIDIAIALVKDYAKLFSIVDKNIRCTGAWINLAGKGDYQEFHQHCMSHFSIVYYIKTPKNCGKIIFRNHSATRDMFNLPIANHDFSPLCYNTYSFEPQEGSMLIFRSNVEHMVEANMSDGERVSLAMNMVIDE